MLEFKSPLLRGMDKVMQWVIMILLMALTLIIGGACLLRTINISSSDSRSWQLWQLSGCI